MDTLAKLTVRVASRREGIIDSTLLFNPYLLERGVREAREEALAMGQSESVGNNGNQIQGEEVKIGHRHPLL
ncbi:MAG: hypothetical protein RMY36_024600 [Nostoc sp. SerVER01]|nr:hypothetical protein [Nostoc sp. SerVER01]